MNTVLMLALLMQVEAKTPRLHQRVSTAVFAAAATADWVTTTQMLARHGVELNPALAWAHNKPFQVVSGGVAMDVAGTLAWKHAMRRHPRIYTTGMVVSAAFRVYLAAHNVRLDARLDRLRR